MTAPERETETEADPGLPATTRIGRVALRVNDLSIVDWYESVVGLTVQHYGDERVVLGAGGEAVLELVADPTAPERSENEAGLFHVAFRVPSRTALADALSRVREEWQLDGASDHLVSEAIYLTDPEDNGVEIYHDRPREEWPSEDDGVGMETLALDLSEFRDLAHGEPTAPSETTVGHVHLEAVSLSASRAFYVDGLGMRVRDRYGEKGLFVAAGDYHHHVGLNTWNERTEPHTGRGLLWFEAVVPDREALDAIRRRFEMQEIDSTGTEERIDATDPNGIDLRLRIAE